MVTTFDIDKVMYHLLMDAGIGDIISGGIYYQGERPTDSKREDIVVNHISLTMDAIPQQAVTNVNVYVGDVSARVDGKEINVANHSRIEEISKAVIRAIVEARVSGYAFKVANMTVVEESSVPQHFANIRVYWTIAVIND